MVLMRCLESYDILCVHIWRPIKECIMMYDFADLTNFVRFAYRKCAPLQYPSSLPPWTAWKCVHWGNYGQRTDLRSRERLFQDWPRQGWCLSTLKLEYEVREALTLSSPLRLKWHEVEAPWHVLGCRIGGTSTASPEISMHESTTHILRVICTWRRGVRGHNAKRVL